MFDYLFLFIFKKFITYIYNFKANFRFSYKNSCNSFLIGFIYIWKHLRFWVPSLIIIILFIYFSIVIRNFPFSKIIVEWFLVAMIFYWLISGFVFFTKKYKFSKFTSAIQRFWRRSFIIFWLIESSLFVVFIYLLFNASQEPVFAYDFIQLKKMRLFSWRFFLYKTFIIYVIIVLTYILMLNLKWNVFSKYSTFLVLITILLTYIVWIEFYQFFYVINWYGEIVWLFDIEDRVWYAESIFKRARIVNHYLTICIIAKFWHIIFMYIFWVFFLIRNIENNSSSYVSLSANLQNFIILYLMNWLLMYPWFKFIFRKFLSKSHSSFYEFRKNYVSSFFYDLNLFCLGQTNFFFFIKKFSEARFSQFTLNSDFYCLSFFFKQFSKNYMYSYLYNV